MHLECSWAGLGIRGKLGSQGRADPAWQGVMVGRVEVAGRVGRPEERGFIEISANQGLDPAQLRSAELFWPLQCFNGILEILTLQSVPEKGEATCQNTRKSKDLLLLS